MGAIKEKIAELADMAEQILDSGVSDQELDEYMEVQLKDEPGMVEFYHAHKDIIFDMLGWEPEEEDEEDEEDDITPRYNRHGFVDNDPYDVDESFRMPQLFRKNIQDEEDPLKDVYDNALILAQIFKEAGKDVSPSGLGRGKHGIQNISLGGERGPDYEFQVSEDGEVTYMGIFGEKKNPVKIGNINDEKTIRDGLYRYLRLGADKQQYESLRKMKLVRESLYEGCNCGGRKRPRPNLIRRPTPVVKRPIVKNYMKSSKKNQIQ